MVPRSRSARRRAVASGLGLLGMLAVPLSAPATARFVLESGRSATSPAGGEWTTYGGEMARTSLQARSPRLRPLRRRWLSERLDGAVYGEPLIDAGLVLAATENDTVYALSASTGRVVWSRHFASPVPASLLPCGNISPAVGVTSTMVLDPGTGTLFVSGSTVSGATVHHVLVALRAASGAVDWRRDIDQPGWSAPAQLQRAALALDDGEVLVGFGGNYGDCGRYHGYVVAVPEAGSGPTRAYKVPTENEGAVWAPSGVTVAANGHIYVATGNGGTRAFDESDSVIELSVGLRRLGVFAPVNWRADSASDADLGSAAPVLLGQGRVFILGKETTAYLLDGARLGGVGGQLASTSACFSQGGDAYLAPLVFVACPGSAMTAVRIARRSMHVVWRSSATDGSPTIAGGVVWSQSGGRLVGLRPRDGRLVASLPSIDATRFAAPSAGEGLLVIGGTSQVEAFEGPHGWTGP